MNAPHFHLILVHIPIVIVPVALLLLGYATYFKQEVVRTIALTFFTVCALITIPTFLIGEDAEEAIEDLPGVSEQAIDNHEDVAEIALWLTLSLGALSGLSLAGKGRFSTGRLTPAVFLLAFASSAALAVTGLQGGKIRHPETAPNFTSSAHGSEQGGGSRRDDD